MARPEETLTLRINGRDYSDWTSVIVQCRYHDFSPKFQVELSEFAPAPSTTLIRNAQIAPGDVVEVLLAGYPVMLGFVEERHVAYDGMNHAVRVVGVAKSYLTTSSVWTQSGSFDRKSIEEFTREMLKPTGVGLKVIGTLDNTPFENIHVQPGEIIADAVSRYAKMRNTIVGSSEFGELTLIGDHSAEIADYLVEGRNILRANMAIRDSDVYQRYIVLGQQNSNDERSGDKSNKQVAQEPGQSRLPRVYVEPAPIADSEHGISQMARFMKNFLEGARIEAHVTVQGWLRDNDELYRAGAYYWVQSPMLPLNQLMGTQSITYEQNAGGTTTTLMLVDPAHMNGNYEKLDQPPLINPSLAPLGPM